MINHLFYFGDKMSEKRANRSNAYQHLFGEVLVAMETLEAFHEDASIYKRLNPHEYNEAVAELEEQLRIRILAIG